METNHPTLLILNRWPTRRAILDDINASLPDEAKLQIVAVHRWFQRERIPAEYDAALLDGASKRNIPLNWRELMDARSYRSDQYGLKGTGLQGQATQ